jgi:hypothetical protein
VEGCLRRPETTCPESLPYTAGRDKSYETAAGDRIDTIVAIEIYFLSRIN